MPASADKSASESCLPVTAVFSVSSASLTVAPLTAESLSTWLAS